MPAFANRQQHKSQIHVNHAASSSDITNMFRFARRIITLFSFFLFAGSAAMCIRSYRHVDFVTHQHVNRAGSTLIRDERILVSGRGGACLTLRHTAWSLPHPDMTEEQIAALPTGWQHELLTTTAYGGDFFQITKKPTKFGFGAAQLQSTATGVTETSRLIIFPWGAPMLLLAIFPFIGTVRLISAYRRHRRLAALNYNGMQTRRLAA